MQTITRTLKELTPPLCYRFIEKLYRSCVRTPINSSHKFQGKVFCIGFNKTGTTSVEQALKNFGYRIGNYSIAVMLMTDWYRGDFDRLIRYCQTAEAFQDIPFSLPLTYRHLDAAFPDAKFILTIRDSEDQWFQSLVKYHTKRYSSDKKHPPNETDLSNFSDYPYPGFVLDTTKMVFDYPSVDLYVRDHYTKIYRQHNQDAIEYFSKRPEKLLILNVAHSDAYQKLAFFLNVEVSSKAQFPWKNKT